MTNRPLSPHLQVYRWSLGMAMSILHRASGAALAAGTVLVIWLLMAAAISPEAYDYAMSCFSSFFGRLILFGWSMALYYHMCNGIRHLVWDTGKLFAIRHANIAGGVVLVAAFGLTALTWYCALN